jgi:hypothetical protein
VVRPDDFGVDPIEQMVSAAESQDRAMADG